MSKPHFAVAAAVAAFGAVFVGALCAQGQAIDVARAHTFVAGSPAPGPRGGARGKEAAGSFGHESLPAGRLVVEWRAALGVPLRRAPIMGPDDEIDVVSTEGEVVTLGRDGTERARLATGANDPSALALLPAGDLVFVDQAGEAVGVRAGHTTFRSRFGRAGAVGPAPLALEDGGVIVATEHEIALLDAAGGERARTTLVDSIQAPLVPASGHIFAISASGAVWSWRPGALSPERIGAFGGPIDGAAALAGDGTLLAALPEQGLIVAVDLGRGSSAVRTTTSEGLWLGPPSIAADLAFVPLLTAAAEFVVGIDRAGNEMSRTVLAGRTAKLAADAGATPLALPPHTPALVDARGTFFFATPGGDIGAASDVRSPNASVDLLADVCGAREPTRGNRTPDPPVVGLVATHAGTVVAACANGTVLSIRGAQ
jgi:hypothetical protein